MPLFNKTWRITDYNYENNFRKAQQFSIKIGTHILPLFFIKNTKIKLTNREKIIDSILKTDLASTNVNQHQLAFKQFTIIKDLQDFLKSKFSVNTTITSGYVYLNGKAILHEPKTIIKKRLKLINDPYDNPFGFHTWLTTDTMEVIDLTLNEGNNLLSNDNSFKWNRKNVNWYEPQKSKSKNGLNYKPIFIGYDYFNKINPTSYLLFNNEIIRPKKTTIVW